jgi:hypothetical protein
MDNLSKVFGRGTGVVFLALFQRVAKSPMSNMASGGDESNFTVVWY